MKHPLFILTLLFSSVFSLSAQIRLGTTPRIINRADNHYFALDSLFLGEEYSNTLLGGAMITRSAFGGNACLQRVVVNDSYVGWEFKRDGEGFFDEDYLEEEILKRVGPYYLF